jgi:transcriptional regulator CtsR
MTISDFVAQRILEILEAANGDAEIKRNELAEALGCVPSQINYVLSSRFTATHGYAVQSRRGGGGYIRITRVRPDHSLVIMHTVHSIGEDLSDRTARALVQNLQFGGVLSPENAVIIVAAVSEASLTAAPAEVKNQIRAAIFKNILVHL